MRAVVQTVGRASVTVDGAVVGAISDGLLVLLGVTHTDTAETARTMARKVHELRILDDERSAADTGAPILVVSQFTLYGDARKGRRPSWTAAAPAEVAEPLVTAVVDALRERGAKVETGRFRAHMLVESTNIGPPNNPPGPLTPPHPHPTPTPTPNSSPALIMRLAGILKIEGPVNLMIDG
ncbi:D-tyrosyl-tRNA(Tyr) deacylase [Micromonospora lupini str. Lupac 08]|uniref:D-aminoacyl-tRNA deacylase n=1 Tax=Micromonospora lupini str. Lupac 08 TaxID=1150864 RepID=I0KYW1_9ACTN|nr:D-tyrosyl-tRNA(Tyr) deacylase [Micromonospora lupini str. Lupac 08]